MAKNLKINIKNAQIAGAINLGSLKSKLAKKEEAPAEESVKGETRKDIAKEKAPVKEAKRSAVPSAPPATASEEAPPQRIKARSRSAFAEGVPEAKKGVPTQESPSFEEEAFSKSTLKKGKTAEELRQEIFKEEIAEQEELQKADELKNKAARAFLQDIGDKTEPTSPSVPLSETRSFEPPQTVQTSIPTPSAEPLTPIQKGFQKPEPPSPRIEREREERFHRAEPRPVEPRSFERRPYESRSAEPRKFSGPPPVKLGPTGRHMRDLVPPKTQPRQERPSHERPPYERSHERSGETRYPRAPYSPRPVAPRPMSAEEIEAANARARAKGREVTPPPATKEEEATAEAKKGTKTAKFKEFRDIKPQKKTGTDNRFDGRDRQGLRETEDDQPWRKKRGLKARPIQEDTTIRPTSLKVRLPIAIKDLAAEMKLKSSQLVQKLFMQGVVVTLNDLLEDETTVQLLGQEFGCEIGIDTSEEERLRITDKSIKEEVAKSAPDELSTRPPVVAFMGHVDHGKTSLIDAIRESNRAAGEAGAITQHIGAFRCKTPVGDIAILDTPGHEAFSAMRARGADVTDIVVLVVAGDEGIRQQTLEAINHARQAGVTIVVAINKADKPNFNPENVYRQLSEQDLLPEAWGGTTITVNCSAVTGQGIPQLLEMLALQAEVLELKANPKMRARGSVLESEMHKGMGAVATVLVQNGTLRLGDPLVFDELWGRVKTMRDEYGKELSEAGPSTPVEITGLSGLPEAGQEFIVVKTEREAREIAEDRRQGLRQSNLMLKKKVSMENLLQQSQAPSKKVLNILLRADVQGSLEALKTTLEKIQSTKAEINIIFAGVGEIGESDVQLAAASKAVILGFHTAIESHADSMIKQLGVKVYLHDIIYHAADEVKQLMVNLLDKIAIETDKGKALVKALFKSSQLGVIAGCQVTEGSITRNNHIRLKRGNELIWKGGISSLKRVKEDVREVQKGFECGIVLNGFSEEQEGDIIEAYEITYITQEL